jgi:hypothetical protein
MAEVQLRFFVRKILRAGRGRADSTSSFLFGNDPIGFIRASESLVSFNTFYHYQTLISFQQLKWPAKSNHLFSFVTKWFLIEKSNQLQRK